MKFVPVLILLMSMNGFAQTEKPRVPIVGLPPVDPNAEKPTVAPVAKPAVPAQAAAKTPSVIPESKPAQLPAGSPERPMAVGPDGKFGTSPDGKPLGVSADGKQFSLGADGKLSRPAPPKGDENKPILKPGEKIAVKPDIPKIANKTANGLAQEPAADETLEFKIIGEAFTNFEHTNPPAALTTEQMTEELAKHKLKVTYRKEDFSQILKSQTSLDKYSDFDGFILRPYEISSPEIRMTLSLGLQSQCYREIEVVSLKKSGINNLAQLSGKSVILQDTSPIINYLADSKVKFKEHFITSNPKSSIEALKSGKVSAIVEVVQKFPEQSYAYSATFGKFAPGNVATDSEFQVVHVTDDKIPCYVFFENIKKVVGFDKRLVTMVKANPDIGHSVFHAMGGFDRIYPITKTEGDRILNFLYKNDSITRYKKGQLNMVFKPYK